MMELPWYDGYLFVAKLSEFKYPLGNNMEKLFNFFALQFPHH